MDKEEYMATSMLLGSLSTQLMVLPLSEFLQAINRAETLGPILDPTLYREGMDGLQETKEIASAFRECQVKLEKLAKRRGGKG